MAGQTQATLSLHGSPQGHLSIGAHDRAVLSDLAAQVAELSARSVEAEKRELWYQHNALKPTRPMVFCDVEIIMKDNHTIRGDPRRVVRWVQIVREETERL